MSKESARKEIEKLIDVFEEHYNSYHATSYDEAKTRLDFINKFFKAFGWDVDNEAGAYEAYREVVVEDRFKAAGRSNAPDYMFRLSGGKKLFFVEAKKPTVKLKTDSVAAYQLRGYGRSAQLPVSILTNFEEFAVYDCTRRPSETDSSSIGRLEYLTYKEYLNKFDFLYDTFSREGVLKGRLDVFIKSDTHKKGSVPLDKDFLEDLNEWRRRLATSIVRKNEQLSEEEVKFAVQLIIDRLIFLRFCEDRQIEPYGQLREYLKRGDYYNQLFAVFKKADAKYNSGLFNFKKDKITPSLIVEDKIIKGIIEELYYPKRWYNYSVMPVEILGNAYEQFLGKVIRITPGHVVHIDDKPEVRKAGGVYYTPQYIVEYIVKNTVGELINGKTPEQIEKIKIVDPACGSGSFLLGAFQYLLDYHLRWYLEHPVKAKKGTASPLTPDQKLTTAEKRRILINNMYGVDIDTQAVEVTKLSLLLKSMEGETEASVKQQLDLYHERILPNLDNNIKCGNSLIGTDYYDLKGALIKDENDKENIRPFDWKGEFQQVFNKGGFDVVIGNPPYVLGRETFDGNIKNYLENNFESYGGKFDLYIYFTERGLKLLSKDGMLGFIVPNTVLANENATQLRMLILKEFSIVTLRTFDKRVFEKVQVESAITIIKNKKATQSHKARVEKEEKVFLTAQQHFSNNELAKFNVSVSGDENKLLEKLKSGTITLGSISDICIGIQLGGSQGKKKKGDFLSTEKKDESWKKVIDGKDIGEYDLKWNKAYVRYGKWLHRRREEKYFLNPKICIRQIGKTPIATFDDSKYYTLNTIYNLITSSDYNLKFLLGIINSQFGKWYWLKNNSDFKTLFPKIKKSQIESVPIVKISKDDKVQNKLYNDITTYVTQLLTLNQQLHQSKLQSTQEELKRRIEHIVKKVDELVYELYGLTKEEIEIVENIVSGN